MKPQEVSDVDVAFPSDVRSLMPKMEEIPEDFHRGHTPWNGVFGDWFYGGAKEVKLVPKEGINALTALRHVKTVMNSFEPKHEHKEAAVAYLLSQWFERIEYVSGGKRKVVS